MAEVQEQKKHRMLTLRLLPAEYAILKKHQIKRRKEELRKVSLNEILVKKIYELR